MFKKAIFSNERAIKLLLCGLVLSLLSGCPAASDSDKPLREYVHQNGLTIKLPKEFSASETANGFLVEPANEANKNRRRPIQAAVSLRGLGETPADDSAKQKIIGNRTIKYRIEKQDGGSGGAEYNFSAYETMNGELISYSQNDQSEDFEPRFDLIWTIIENTSLRK